LDPDILNENVLTELDTKTATMSDFKEVSLAEIEEEDDEIMDEEDTQQFKIFSEDSEFVADQNTSVN
jgi:formylmethanofuran dehydrogenase subunit D